METSFYTHDEMKRMGFKSLGKNVKISRYARFYGIEKISIGNNVRIDDFCILSGNITLGNHIHISAFCALYGANGITLHDYSGISGRCTVYSAMDDFGGDYLIGPIHNRNLTHVTGGTVTLERYTQIGAHCCVFPNLTIREGSVVGACSLVTQTLDSWGVYWGVPAIRHRERSSGVLDKLREVSEQW